MNNDEATRHFARKLEHEIDAWDLQAAMTAREPVLVIDARSTAAYHAEHIPGALNLPHGQMDARTTAGLPRDVLIVTYCDGIGCNASTKAALNLSRLGFRVRELIGGLDWWKRDGYATACGESQRTDCGCA